MPGLDEIPVSNIFEKIPLGVLILDDQDRIKEWNNILEGWTSKLKEEVLDQDVRELFPNTAQNKYQSRLEAIFKGGPPTVFLSQLHKYFLPIETKDGSLARQQTTVSPLKTSEGQMLALICIQDVSDLSNRVNAAKEMRDQALAEVKIRKETEKKLEGLNQEFQAFSYRVAHDLRGPLSLSSSLSDLGLMEGGKLDPKDLFNRIKNSSVHGLRIIDGIYKLSGLSKTEIKYVKLDIKKMLDDVLLLLEMEAKERKMEIEVDCSHEIEGSSELMPQVFQNIISNAIKYCKADQPKLKIWSESDSETVKMHFEDNGPGVPKDKREEIFKSFVRLEKHAKEEGLGLDLSLVKKILELHRVHMQVNESKELGGARFTLVFPKIP